VTGVFVVGEKMRIIAQRRVKLKPAAGRRPGRPTDRRGDEMLELLRDLWAFMRERKKFWLAPIILVMLLLGALIVLSQGSAVAPFIYTLF
jgi:hypothetical protein